MTTKHIQCLSAFIVAAIFCHQSLAVTLSDQLKIYGDIRLRLESDFDSQRSNGTDRDDRDRFRMRFRLGLTFTPQEKIEVGVRLRSGSDDSHQSPHITLIDFDDSPTGDSDFNLDKWYFKYKWENSTFSAGRDNTSLWRQNEIFLEDDLTPVGLSYYYQGKNVGLNLGYYELPVGMKDFSGNLGIVQLDFNADIGSGYKYKVLLEMTTFTKHQQ